MSVDTGKQLIFKAELVFIEMGILHRATLYAGRTANVVVSDGLNLFLDFLGKPDVVLVGNGYIVASSLHNCRLEVLVES
jgi:hypothetical protein